MKTPFEVSVPVFKEEKDRVLFQTLYLNILILKQEMLRHLGLFLQKQVYSLQTHPSGTELIHIRLLQQEFIVNRLKMHLQHQCGLRNQFTGVQGEGFQSREWTCAPEGEAQESVETGASSINTPQTRKTNKKSSFYFLWASCNSLRNTSSVAVSLEHFFFFWQLLPSQKKILHFSCCAMDSVFYIW